MFLKSQSMFLIAVRRCQSLTSGFASHCLPGLLIFLCTAISVAAQTTSGSITGNVVDAQRAAIPNATVTITDVDKGFTQTATTDEEGRFVFPQVPPGTFDIVIQVAGFKKQERKDVALVANDKLSLGNMMLEVGAVTETVEVIAEATLIQSESGERSSGVQSEELRNIGIRDRSFVNFVTLVPGVISSAASGTTGDVSTLYVNGTRQNSNNVQIDGVTSIDTGNNSLLARIPVEAIGELKVLTSGYQAEYGRSTGAQVIATTRSGSKDFHGAFYFYRRHTGLNANSWLNNRNGVPRAFQDQKDTGYNIGGPIYIPGLFNKDRKKLFFFWNQEYAHRFTPPTGPTNVRVPTALERTGDFSQSRDNNGNLFPYIRDYTLNLPCSATNTTGCFKDGGVLGKIPQNRLYGPGIKILNLYPLPNYTPVGNDNFNYRTQASSQTPERNDTLRIDYNVSKNWRIWGRWLNTVATSTLPYGNSGLGLSTNLPDFGATQKTPKYSYSGTVTGSLNATTVVEFTYGISHNLIDLRVTTDAATRAATGLSNFPLLYPDALYLDQIPNFTWGGRVANGPSIDTKSGSFENFNTTQDFVGSISKVWGDHVSKAGVYYFKSLKPQTARFSNNGSISFSDNANNPFDTQFGFANAITGAFNTYQQASSHTTGNYKYFNLEWYLQDNWKVNKRLTLDYGMRFVWMPPQYETKGQAANFLPDKFDPAKASRLYRPVCINGVTTCAAGSANRRAVDPVVLASGVPLTTGNTLLDLYVGRIVPNSGNFTNGLFTAGQGIPEALVNDNGVQLAPRFGFAYDLTGKHDLIVRGGIGIFYDRTQGNLIFDQVQNPPNNISSTINLGRLQDISANNVLLSPPTLRALQPDAKLPMNYAFNLGIQYKLPLDAILDVSYVGSQGRHLPQFRNINAVPYGAAFLPQNQDPTRNLAAGIPGSNALPADFLAPYQGFNNNNIVYIEYIEKSNYNSMQTSINRRFSRGLLLRMSYTWSKALGTISDDQNFARIDKKFDYLYGPQNFDRRHNLNFNWVYAPPKLTHNKYLGYVANNWQLSGIYRYQSGAPYTIGFSVTGYGNQNLTGSPTEGARIGLLGSPGSGHSSDPYKQFDVTVFQAPSVGSTGLESGRNYLTLPPINNWDLSLSKRFVFGERYRFEARLDAFNALNHTQFNGVNSTANFASPGSTVITNLANETTNRNGFGSISSVRPPRNMQWMVRFEF
jgi:carboxypeptidase family protein/TonB-dependent receptor-like protein